MNSAKDPSNRQTLCFAPTWTVESSVDNTRSSTERTFVPEAVMVSWSSPRVCGSRTESFTRRSPAVMALETAAEPLSYCITIISVAGDEVSEIHACLVVVVGSITMKTSCPPAGKEPPTTPVDRTEYTPLPEETKTALAEFPVPVRAISAFPSDVRFLPLALWS